MKKTCFLFLFLFFGTHAHSQILISLLFGDKLNSPNLEFGIDGGISWSEISSLESSDQRGGLNLGFYFDIRIKNNFWLNTGLMLKSAQGLNNLTDGDLVTIGATPHESSGDYGQELSYWYLPVLAKYKFENRIHLELGPQLGLIRNANVRFESSDGNLTTLIEEDNVDHLNRFDVGVVGGVSYRLLKDMGMSIGVRYYYGFIDIYERVSGTTNSHIYLHAEIPIGAKEISQ
ncbi:MAG: PorT family protein [Flavobacteriales bacterium]|nr:PorT family protein [Flavobacteriales bacterium]